MYMYIAIPLMLSEVHDITGLYLKQTDVVTWARLVRQAAPHHPDTLSPMPLQSESSVRAEENGKAQRYRLNDMHHGFSSDANRPLSPSSKSGYHLHQNQGPTFTNTFPAQRA